MKGKCYAKGNGKRPGTSVKKNRKPDNSFFFIELKQEMSCDLSTSVIDE